MPKIDTVKRITTDEFSDEDQEVAERIGNIYNYFAEQVTNVLNGGIDSENTGRPIIQLSAVVDANGTPVRQIKFTSNAGLKGIKVINAVNRTNRVNYVENHPFISFLSQGTGVYTIENIKGLITAQDYLLTLELVF